MDQSLGPSLPRYNPIGFLLFGLCKVPRIPSNVGSVVELRSRINNTVASVTLQMLENICNEIRVQFWHSASFKWRSHCDVLSLMSCASNQSKPIPCISYTECFVCNKFWRINCGHSVSYITRLCECFQDYRRNSLLSKQRYYRSTKQKVVLLAAVC
jgi:hypothetical protein